MRVLQLCAALIIVWPVAFAHAQDNDINADLKTLIDEMENVDGMDVAFNACPADVFRSQSSLRVWLFGYEKPNIYRQCEDDPLKCARICFNGKGPNECFYTARIVQEMEFGQSDAAYQRLFAWACAVGSPGGCTNRGASIRNAPSDEDGQTLLPPQEIDNCLYRTFRDSCAAGDSWGCAMSGQTYEFGEGVEANEERAISLFRKACDLASTPEFPSCRFAERHIERLTGQ